MRVVAHLSGHAVLCCAVGRMHACSAKRSADQELEDLYRRADADPFDIEVQKKIEEIIQQKNIDEQYSHIMENNPEVRCGAQAAGWLMMLRVGGGPPSPTKARMRACAFLHGPFWPRSQAKACPAAQLLPSVGPLMT